MSAGASGHAFNPQRSYEAVQDCEAGDGSQDGGDGVRRSHPCAGHDARNNHRTHEQHTQRAQSQLWVSLSAQHTGQHCKRQVHARKQRSLVIRTKRGDHKVLQPRRREVGECRHQGKNRLPW